MSKISVGQIICELICNDYIREENYKIFSNSWNKMSFETRTELSNNITAYLCECVGVEQIEK